MPQWKDRSQRGPKSRALASPETDLVLGLIRQQSVQNSKSGELEGEEIEGHHPEGISRPLSPPTALALSPLLSPLLSHREKTLPGLSEPEKYSMTEGKGLFLPALGRSKNAKVKEKENKER